MIDDRQMCGLQVGPGEYCDDERMPFERWCAFHTLRATREQLHQLLNASRVAARALNDVLDGT